MPTIRTLPAALLLAGLLCAPAGAATFIVTEAGDSKDTNLGDGQCTTMLGTCSLRAALGEALALSGSHRIEFNIPTAPNTPAVIAPNSALPTVNRAVEIDGTTQPGSSGNTLPVGNNAVVNVILDGTNAGQNATGLHFFKGASGASVRGLAITRFDGVGIRVDGQLIANGGLQNVTIAGNFIGTDGSGTGDDAAGLLRNGGPGVFIWGQARNTTVGGPAPADRNLIVGSSGVQIINAHQNLLQNNYIGTDRAGDRGAPTWAGLNRVPTTVVATAAASACPPCLRAAT